MDLYKLYKVTATNAVQVWWQELEGDRYRTHSGQVDGKIVTSEWTIAEPKNVGRANMTSAEDQALLEVESKYARKMKDGYTKSVAMARKSGMFKPMLAKNFADYEAKIHYPVWCQPKLDGIRCLLSREGMFSRRGDRIESCPHIWEAAQPILEALPDLVLDGELYNHELREDFNELTSLVRSTKKQRVEAADLIQYHIYDCYAPESFNVRSMQVLDVVDSLGHPFVAVDTKIAASRLELDQLYTMWLDENYEGQMVRINGPYEQKRSKLLLKRKEFVDSEFEVVELLEGRGNASGGAKKAVLRLDTNPDVLFKADIMGTVAQRQMLLRDAAMYVGKQATVKYFAQRTPDGIPRFGKVKAFHLETRW